MYSVWIAHNDSDDNPHLLFSGNREGIFEYLLSYQQQLDSKTSYYYDILDVGLVSIFQKKKPKAKVGAITLDKEVVDFVYITEGHTF